jgi:hypothetical protein
MEFLPILEKPFNQSPYFEKNFFHANIWTEIKEIHTIIKDCIEGSCYAITVKKESTEIIYNGYDNTRLEKDIILQEMIRQQLIINPHHLIKPLENRTVDIYMFLEKPWCLSISYYEGIYNIKCFSRS